MPPRNHLFAATDKVRDNARNEEKSTVEATQYDQCRPYLPPIGARHGELEEIPSTANNRAGLSRCYWHIEGTYPYDPLLVTDNRKFRIYLYSIKTKGHLTSSN